MNLATPGRAGLPIGAWLVLLLCVLVRSASATPLISELFYDAVGSDDGESFVELWAPPGTSLDGLVLEGINGSGGGLTVSISLSGTVAADGLFLLADSMSGGGSAVPGADLLANFDFQNGPDSVVLRDTLLDVVIDAVGYGVFDVGDVFAGEGMAAPDPAAGSSLARHFADVDSDDNATDFGVLAVPTPGFAPVQSVPEPSTGLLAAAALGGLAMFSRRLPEGGAEAGDR